MMGNHVRGVATPASWTAALIIAGAFSSAVPAGAASTRDFDGAWSTSAEACPNIFVKRGGQIYLSERADLFGSGFVVAGSIIRGKIATCKVTSIKRTGAAVDLRTVCTTDITTISNSFKLRLVDANRVVRSVPEIPELDTPYVRCPAIQ